MDSRRLYIAMEVDEVDEVDLTCFGGAISAISIYF